MTQNLNDFLTQNTQKSHAVQNGTLVHAKMQNIVIDGDYICGDSYIINIIQQRADLLPFFTKNAKTEVPIAGIVNSCFISRRIDRLLINHDTKTIDFIDYKTDKNKDEFIDKYRYQLKEYAELLYSAYPDYKINGYILWLHDWVLDKIIA